MFLPASLGIKEYYQARRLDAAGPGAGKYLLVPADMKAHLVLLLPADSSPPTLPFPISLRRKKDDR